MKIIQRPSPNFNSREGQEIDLIVLHYTDMLSVEEALQRLCDPQVQVSAHYLIGRQGDIYQLVDEHHRAWHAGISQWPDKNGQMKTNINSSSIGIELDNPGHLNGYISYTDIQMRHLVLLLQDICTRVQIPPNRIVGHEDVSPGRKRDPGELFDWQFLARQGLGKLLHSQ